MLAGWLAWLGRLPSPESRPALPAASHRASPLLLLARAVASPVLLARPVAYTCYRAAAGVAGAHGVPPPLLAAVRAVRFDELELAKLVGVGSFGEVGAPLSGGLKACAWCGGRAGGWAAGCRGWWMQGRAGTGACVA